MRFLCAASPSSPKKIVYLLFGYCKFFIWMARRPSIGLYCHSLLCLVLLLIYNLFSVCSSCLVLLLIYYLFSVCSSCLVLLLTYLYSVCGSMPCASSHIFVFCLKLYALCFFSDKIYFLCIASHIRFIFMYSSMLCSSSHVFVFCL